MEIETIDLLLEALDNRSIPSSVEILKSNHAILLDALRELKRIKTNKCPRHLLVDMTNQVVSNGYLCVVCGEMFEKYTGPKITSIGKHNLNEKEKIPITS